jgi:hypothetical protein
MKRFLVPTMLLFMATAAFAQRDAQTPNSNMKFDPPALGIHWAKDAKPGQARRTSNPNMTYHNGPIMNNVYTQAIFWGTSWPTYSGDEITGMDSWYNGINGTQYARTVDEFTSTTASNGAGTLTYGGHIVDSSAASGGQNTSNILAEVCRQITNPVSNGYYPVYTDLPRGGAQYCAWHSNGTCGSTHVQFAFFWKLDGDSGCNPTSTVAGQTEGLQAAANVSGHEMSEMRNDPNGNAWYDSSGSENGDKCAWRFGTAAITFSNGTQWKIQGNWSNWAYNNNAGYANSSGYHGCLDGGNYTLPTSVAP